MSTDDKESTDPLAAFASQTGKWVVTDGDAALFLLGVVAASVADAFWFPDGVAAATVAALGGIAGLAVKRTADAIGLRSYVTRRRLIRESKTLIRMLSSKPESHRLAMATNLFMENGLTNLEFNIVLLSVKRRYFGFNDTAAQAPGPPSIP